MNRKKILSLILASMVTFCSLVACSESEKDESDEKDDVSSVSDESDEKNEDIKDDENNLNNAINDAISENNKYSFDDANEIARTVYTAAATYITEYAEQPILSDGETPKTAPDAGALCGNAEIWDNQQCDSLSDAVNKYLGADKEGTYWAVYCTDVAIYGTFWYDEDSNVIGSYPTNIDPDLLPEDFEIPQGGNKEETGSYLDDDYYNEYIEAFNSLQQN